jgi:hypothetical protein
MPPAGFEPTIPARERPQKHALDRAATGIGFVTDYHVYKIHTVRVPIQSNPLRKLNNITIGMPLAYE